MAPALVSHELGLGTTARLAQCLPLPSPVLQVTSLPRDLMDKHASMLSASAALDADCLGKIAS